MRLDARQGDTHYQVYDAKRCLVPEDVIWVDTDTAQWGQADHEASRRAGEWVTRTIQEDSITVCKQLSLVVFNQVEDAGPSDALMIMRDSAKEIAEATLYRGYKWRRHL